MVVMVVVKNLVVKTAKEGKLRELCDEHKGKN
jgi:hypothetical protein